ATTHLVDNGFFLQFIQHFSPFEVQPWRTFPQRGEERARPPRSAAVGENSPKFSDPETCSVYGRTDNCTDLACGCSLAIRKRHANTTSRLYRDRPKSREIKPAGRLLVTPPRFSVIAHGPPSPSQRTRLLPATANQWVKVVRSAPGFIPLGNVDIRGFART